MLTAEDLRVVLASAPLRQAHGLELPEGSLNTLAADPGAFSTFYEQWNAQGQPRYVPPTPVQDAAPAAPPAPAPALAPVMAMTPPVPVPPIFGPPPTALVAPQQVLPPPYSTPPYSAAPYSGSPYSGSPYSGSPYSGSNYLDSPNAVAPGGLARPGMVQMLWGFGIAIVGVIVTGATWAAAAPGGTFVVAWGAIIFGTIRGIIGVVRLNRGH
jgi:hypothetical protein